MPACAVCGAAYSAADRVCPRCGGPVGSPPGATAGAHDERRMVTILFADLVGFTALGEALDPEDLRAVQQTYFDAVTTVIRRSGGVVEKYIGDAVMAVFGAPVTHEDDALRAVHAGLELSASVEARVVGPDGPLHARVGIATGEVVVDLDAMHDGGQALVAGDVVNVAARLQQHAPAGSVLVTSVTRRATADAVEYAATPPVAVRGKAAPIEVWRALRLVQRRWDDQPDRAPFLGRDAPLAALVEVLAQTVAERRARMVSIVGPAGIGKSRLVREFNRAAERALPVGVNWLGGRCAQSGQRGVFGPLADVVAQHAQVFDADDAETARRKLRASLAELFTEPERTRVAEALAPLVGVADTAVEADDAEAAWRELLYRLATRRPLVVVIEDLHWAQPPLLRFLHRLVVRAADIPLLVVTTLRPPEPEDGTGVAPAGTGEVGADGVDADDAGPADTAAGDEDTPAAEAYPVVLGPLTDDETLRLCTELLSGAAVSAAALRRLTTLAAGTPLYAHEYVRMVRERHPDADAPGSPDPVGDLPLPDSIHAVVASRVDLLDLRARRALYAAAVIGETFWPDAVAVLTDLDPSDVEPVLAELVDRGFIRPATESSLADQPAFTFGHPLVRDLTYRRQPRAVRLVRHRRAARWLESRAPDRATDAVDAIAHHRVAALELAETLSLATGPYLRPARAALLRAAERAASLHATATALGLLDRALDLWPDDASDSTEPAEEVARLEAVVWRWQLRFLTDADAFHTAGGTDDLAASADRLLAAGAVAAAARTHTLLAQVERARANRAAALDHLDRALALFAPLPDSAEKAGAYAELARLRMMNYEAGPAVEAARTAMVISRRLNLPELEMSALITQAVVRYTTGEADGLALLERAVEECRQRHLRSLRRAADNLAVALQEEGEIDRSYALLDEGASLAIGDATANVLDYCDASMRGYFAGDWDQAIGAAEQYLAGRAADDGGWEVLSLRTLVAWMQVLRGNDPGVDLDQCLAAARHGGFRLTVACVLAHGALCRALRGDLGGAAAWLRLLEAENTAEAFASREWLAAAAHATSLASVAGARWLRDVLAEVPRETLWVRAARSVVDGGLADHDGAPAEAVRHYRAAASVYRRMGNATDAALAAAWAVRAAGAAGDLSAVQEELAQLTDFATRNHTPRLLPLARLPDRTSHPAAPT